MGKGKIVIAGSPSTRVEASSFPLGVHEGSRVRRTPEETYINLDP
jgi:hypothetical protein